MDYSTKRTPNFSRDETDLLMLLAEKFKSILGRKRMDNDTNLKKDATWKQIEHEYNANSPCSTYRCDKKLKIRYFNVKTNLKKFAADKKIMNSTETTSNLLERMDASDDCDPNNSIGKTEYIIQDNQHFPMEPFEGYDNPNVNPVRVEYDLAEDTPTYDLGYVNPSNNAKRVFRNSAKYRTGRCAFAKLAALKYTLTKKKFAAEVKAFNAEHKKKMHILKERIYMAREKHILEMEILN